MTAAHVLQRLYDAKVNFTISTLWDCGFRWQLGDELNGYVLEGRATTFDAAVADLAQAAIAHFPNSTFAHRAPAPG
jgi:hypothetical protein